METMSEYRDETLVSGTRGIVLLALAGQCVR